MTEETTYRLIHKQSNSIYVFENAEAVCIHLWAARLSKCICIKSIGNKDILIDLSECSGELDEMKQLLEEAN